MPQTCTICRNPHRADIDAALVAGEPLRHVASRYGTSTGALQRHRRNDLETALVRAKEAREEEHGDDLLDQVHALIEKARSILEDAEDQRTALVAVRELRGTLELLARLTGQLNPPALPAYNGPMLVFPAGSHIDVGIRPRDENASHREIDVTPSDA